MKKITLFLLSACIGFSIFAAGNEKKEEDSSKGKTSEVSGLTTIQDLMPGRIEELKNETVTFETTFKAIDGEMPEYFEKNGKKNDKYFLLKVEPVNLTVLCKKKSEFDELIMSLKRDDKILICGKIKKFTLMSHYKKSRAYYLEVEKIELVKNAADNIEAKEKYLRKKLKEIEDRKNNNANK